MAAPFVAGTAGLLREQQPGWGPDLLFGQLVRSSGNALQALTVVPVPDLRLVTVEVVDEVGSCPTCDGDGRPDSGETVDVVVTARNWWGNAEDVNGTLSTVDALATVLDGTATWGAIGPNASDDNADNPFRVEISPTAGNNRDIVFDLAVSAVNGGTGIAEAVVLTVQRGVEKGGVLTASETWTADNLYLVTENLLVMPGVVLTIEPGTRVELGYLKSITVRGEFVARGTSTDWIEITGDSWSRILFDGQSPPAVYDGDGNYLSGNAVEYCILSGALETGGAHLETYGTYVAHNIFRNMNRTVVGLWGGSHFIENLLTDNDSASLTLVHGTVRSNTVVGNRDGVGTWGVGLERNNLFGNARYSLAVNSPSDVLVASNYWGCTDSECIGDVIDDFFDEPD